MTPRNLSYMLVLIVTVSTTDRAGAMSYVQGPPAFALEANATESTPASPALSYLVGTLLGMDDRAPFLQPLAEDDATSPEQATDDCAAYPQRKKLHGKIDRSIVKVAQLQLTLPMGTGRRFAVGGKSYLFCLEPHYHEPGSGQKPEGWHKGVTVYDAR